MAMPPPAGTPGGLHPDCRACQDGDHLNCPAIACRCQRTGHPHQPAPERTP